MSRRWHGQSCFVAKIGGVFLIGGKDFSKNVAHNGSLLKSGRHLALSRVTDTCDSKDLKSEFYGLAANAGRRLAATTGATESKAGIHTSLGKIIVG